MKTGSRAPKLAAMLGLSRESGVLLAGKDLGEWEPDFADYFGNLRVASPAQLRSNLDGTRFDLIVLTPGFQDHADSADEVMRSLFTSLTREGSVFVLAENRYGARAARRDPRRLLSGSRNSIPRYRHQLERAGFQSVREFLPLPNLTHAEEFVCTQHGEIALASYASRLETVLNRAGMLWLIHDGAAFIASSRDCGPAPVLEEIRSYLEQTGKGCGPVELDRFDLRDRGALVLMLRWGSQRIVCRLGVDEEINRTLRRNFEWTTNLVNADNISQSVKSLIPQPLGFASLQAGSAQLEALMPGTIAWKLAGSEQAESRMLREMERFLIQLGHDTGRKIAADRGAAEALLDPVRPLRIDEQIGGAYDRLRELLLKRITGKSLDVVLSHGDFGYGNAIASAPTGKLNGIIDWDQAREDMLGLDLVNFLIQRQRSRASVSLPEAFQSVGAQIIAGGFGAVNHQLTHDKEFPLDAGTRAELTGVAALRFAQRDMAYPEVFASARNDLLAVMHCAIGYLT